MKTVGIKFLLLGLVAIMSLTTSCKKDTVTTDESSDSMVGVWNVTEGDADVYLSGTLFEVDITTDGTLSFKEDGSGISNFRMTMMGETDAVTGNFTWERDGFEIIVDDGDEQERWVLVDDEQNAKTVQFSVDTDEDTEVEFTLILARKN